MNAPSKCAAKPFKKTPKTELETYFYLSLSLLTKTAIKRDRWDGVEAQLLFFRTKQYPGHSECTILLFYFYSWQLFIKLTPIAALWSNGRKFHQSYHRPKDLFEESPTRDKFVSLLKTFCFFHFFEEKIRRFSPHPK